MIASLESILNYLSIGISIISTLILTIGVVQGTVSFVKMRITKMSVEERLDAIQLIRVNLGTYILLGLEILIAADIIDTIAKPQLIEIARLMGIVIIRASTSYFLNKEIAEMEDRQAKNKELADNK